MPTDTIPVPKPIQAVAPMGRSGPRAVSMQAITFCLLTEDMWLDTAG